MSQNGPYSGHSWPSGSPEQPYSEPSDPWSGQAQELPQQQAYAPPAEWQKPEWKKPPARRGFAMGATVAALSVLIGGGVATAAWFTLGGKKNQANGATTTATTPAVAGPRPQTSADARFATKGQCVRNEGTNTEPKLRIVVCTANTYEILKRIDGRTTGEKDAVRKCETVPKYTKWYYYDTEYDDVDFVLCLREYEPV
jgi:hypothetical protein